MKFAPVERFAQTDEFWSSFKSQFWESKPVLLKSVFPEQLVTKPELFGAILSKPSTASSDRFWVSKSGGRDYRLVDLGMFGPKSSDGCFDVFFERARRNLKGRQFGVNIHNLQTGAPALWFRFRDFLHGLIQRVGLPTQQWDIDTFFGNYEFTPFGIHQDNASVFALGLLGQRTYYAWPEDYFKKGDPALHTSDVSKMKPHLEHAIQMELRPGDIAYWPSSHWHVVGSDGEPSIVVQASAYFGVQLDQMLNQMMSQHLSQTLNPIHLPVFPYGETLPDPLSAAARELKNFCNNGILERRLNRLWLRLLSADGFRTVPPLTEPSSPLPEKISIHPRRPVPWMEESDGLAIAANGHLFQASSEMRGFLEKLHEVKSLPVSSLSSTERDLVTSLMMRRALEVG